MSWLADYFKQPDLRWWTYSRFEALGSGRFLAGAPGEQYLVVVEGDSASFSVDLADASGTLAGRWYDISQA